MRRTGILIALVFVMGQPDICAQHTSAFDTVVSPRQNFRLEQTFIPAALIGYGFLGLENPALTFLNKEIREETIEHIDEKASIDDFLQYTPMVSVYGLNWSGVKGRHNFRERTIILGSGMVMMAGVVYGLKHITHQQRPDNTTNDAFPSGHTATAFAGAELLYREYKHRSPWYGVAGYGVAATTGIYRVYNNRHWLTDVVAGAGIGIISVRAAYWLQPWLNRKLRIGGKKMNSGYSFSD